MSDAATEEGGVLRDAKFEEEVLSCLPSVMRFARSLTRDAADADDLVQDTFLLAYRGYHTFRAGDSVRRWLLTICHHAFVRQRKRASRFAELGEGTAEAESLAAALGHLHAQQQSEGDLFDRIDIVPAVERALRDLPPPFRATLVLVDMEGLSYAEAAEAEGVRVGTIRSRLFRARRFIQEQLLAVAHDAGLCRASAPEEPRNIPTRIP